MLMITENGDGLFHVVKVTERRLGSFAERPYYAELFRDAMEGRLTPDPEIDTFDLFEADAAAAADEQPETETPASADLARSPILPEGMKPVTRANKPEKAVKSEADLPPQQAAQLTVKGLDAETLSALIARLDAGEPLRDVAASAGIGWASLRGSYANARRYRQAQITETSECKMCGKAFRPSVSQPDTCARCSREVA